MLGASSTTTTWLATGTVVLLFAYLIRFQGWTFLIAGYDGTSTVSESAAATVVGNMLFRVAVGSFVVALLGAVGAVPWDLLGVGFSVLVGIDIGQAIVRLNT